MKLQEGVQRAHSHQGELDHVGEDLPPARSIPFYIGARQHRPPQLWLGPGKQLRKPGLLLPVLTWATTVLLKAFLFILKTFIFCSSFRIIAKLSRIYQEFLLTPSSPDCCPPQSLSLLISFTIMVHLLQLMNLD